MQLVPSPLSTHPPVLPNWQLSGNSRPGFERKNPALYPGHEVWNSTTAIGMRAGLFLNGVRQSELARYYDSRTGTFCSADPLAGDPSDPQSWNRYPYGRNDPIDMTDPTGQHWWDWLALGGALVGDYFTFGALTGALAAEFPSGIQIGIDAASAAASAAGTGIAASHVWHDSFSVPYGGLTNGIQTAAGLPTMSDISPIFDVTQASSVSKLCNNVNAVNFVKSHVADAAMVAKLLHVPTENVLGLSAHESQWGVGRFATQENAFFSEEGGPQPALSNGVMHPTGNPKVNVWGFPSYLASAQGFAARYGNNVNGATDPAQFAGNLQKVGFNSGTKAGNGTPGWSSQVVRDIANTKTRMNCP